jgi:DNA repair exonuclease SbcCD ATPase subunit
MRHFQSINFNDYILFSNETFNFTDGVTVIKGRNSDSKAKNSGNAVGKSLIFTSIPMIAYGSSPMAERKNSAKSFLQKSSSLSLTMADKKSIYTLGQKTKGNSVDYSVSQNGTPKDIKTLADKKAQISDIIGVSEEAFYSTVLISIYRPSPLWKGTSSVRYDFFEKTFDLQFYNKIYKELSKRIIATTAKSMAASELEKQLLSLKSEALTSIDLKELKDNFKDSEKKHKAAFSAFIRATKKGAKYKSYMEFFDKLQYPLLDAKQASDKHDKLNAICSKLAADRRNIISDIEIAEKSLKLESSNSKLIKEAENLAKKLSSNTRLSRHSENELKTLAKKYVDRLRKYEKLKLLYEQYEKEIVLYKKYGLEGKKFNKVYNEEKIKKEIANIEHNYKLLDIIHTTGTCPVCKSKVKSIKKPTLALKGLASKLKKAKLADIKRLVEEKFDKLIDIEAEVKKIQTKLHEITSYQDDLNRYNDIQTQIHNTKKSKVLIESPKIALKVLKKRLKEVNEKGATTYRKVTKLKADTLIHEQLLAISSKSPKAMLKKIGKYQKTLATIRDTYENLNRKHQSLSVSYTKAMSNRRNLQDIKKRMEKLAKATDLLQKLKLLQQAAGPKGIKKVFLKSLAKNYISLLNYYSQFVYNEPYSFAATLTNRNFDILVERNGKTASDIRYLSGSEAHKFLIVSGLALRHMLPPNKKFNNIIFDEIEVSSSDQEQAKFFDKFIPFIKQQIKSVTFITPNTDLHIENSREIIVEKKNGKSKINIVG